MLQTHPWHARHSWRARSGAGLCAMLPTGLGHGVQAQDSQPAVPTIELRLSVHEGENEGEALLGQPRLRVQDGQAAAVEFRSDSGEQAGKPLRIGIRAQ